MVNYTDKTNNCAEGRNFCVVEGNVWQWRKWAEANKLKNLSVEYHLEESKCPVWPFLHSGS